jgi:hypothetical protein
MVKGAPGNVTPASSAFGRTVAVKTGGVIIIVRDAELKNEIYY